MEHLLSRDFVRRGPNVTAIIQARMGSERLPGKVLMNLHGEPVLKWVLYRVSQAKLVDQIVVATPDKRIADVVSGWGVWGFWWRGDENDLVARTLAAAHWCNAEIIVRITADCPLVDPGLIDDALGALGEYDFLSTVLSRNQQGRWYPKGCEVEVMPIQTLIRINELAKDSYDREHATAFLYKNPPDFRVCDLDRPEPDPYIDWCVDTREDLDRMSTLFDTVPDVAEMGYEEIVSVLRASRDRYRPRGDRENHEPAQGRETAL